MGAKLAVDVEDTSTSPASTRRTPLASHTPGYLRLTPTPTQATLDLYVDEWV